MSTRESLLGIIVDLHNIATVIDNVLRRNGGPVKTSRSRRKTISVYDDSPLGSLLSDSREPRSTEPALRFMPYLKSESTISDTIDERMQSTSRDVSIGLIRILFDIICVVILFSYDSLCIIVGRSSLAVLECEPTRRVYPGRSRSPVREDTSPEDRPTLLLQIFESARKDRRTLLNSLVGGLCVQILIFVGSFPFSLLIYICRSICFLFLCLLVWDHVRSRQTFANIPHFGSAAD